MSAANRASVSERVGAVSTAIKVSAGSTTSSTVNAGEQPTQRALGALNLVLLLRIELKQRCYHKGLSHVLKCALDGELKENENE